MLAQEKKTRDALSASNASHKEDIQKSDAKIKKLQEQLKQVCGEVSDLFSFGDTVLIHRTVAHRLLFAF